MVEINSEMHRVYLNWLKQTKCENSLRVIVELKKWRELDETPVYFPAFGNILTALCKNVMLNTSISQQNNSNLFDILYTNFVPETTERQKCIKKHSSSVRNKCPSHCCSAHPHPPRHTQILLLKKQKSNNSRQYHIALNDESPCHQTRIVLIQPLFSSTALFVLLIAFATVLSL